MPVYKCSVKGIEPLRLPDLYRVKLSCDNDVSIEVELHEKIMKIRESEEIEVYIDKNKDKCLQYDFCGRAHVVSITKFEEYYRVILSIAGPLVVIKLKEQPRSPFKVMNELYVGIKKLAKD